MADHINGNGLDNRSQNLRRTTRWQNMQNRRGWGRGSKTMGVYYKATGKWIASVMQVLDTREEAEAEAEAIRIHDLVYITLSPGRPDEQSNFHKSFFVNVGPNCE